MNVKHRSGMFYRSGVPSQSVARDHSSDWLNIMVAAVARDIAPILIYQNRRENLK